MALITLTISLPTTEVSAQCTEIGHRTVTHSDAQGRYDVFSLILTTKF